MSDSWNNLVEGVKRRVLTDPAFAADAVPDLLAVAISLVAASTATRASENGEWASMTAGEVICNVLRVLPFILWPDNDGGVEISAEIELSIPTIVNEWRSAVPLVDKTLRTKH